MGGASVTAPRIARRWDGSVRLTFPYAAELVDALKAQIPAHARTYDPDSRAWTITVAHASVAARLMHQTFADVETVDAQAGPTADRGDPPREAALVVLHLRPSAPPELVDAAYRCLARLHHPDAGGDHDAMLRLNQALEVLR